MRRRRTLSVLRIAEFQALLAAQLISLAGDQLARVALSVLVYQRTHSPLAVAGVFAATWLPLAVGGPLLGGLADRLPRRQVMVGADLARAALVAIMVLPGLPTWSLVVIIVLVTILQAPFDASRAATLPDVLPGIANYVSGSALERLVQQGAQVAGYGLGGLLLLVVEPRIALAGDAASFLISAALLVTGLRPRPASGARGAGDGAWWRHARADATAGVRLVLGRADLRRLVLVTWTAVLIAIVPEGLAAPWAAQLGAGPVGVGLLLAAVPAGNALAGLALPLLSERTRARLLAPLALSALLPLALVLPRTPLPLCVGAVALAGAGMSFSLLARAQFAARVPSDLRGRAFATANTGLFVAQGVGAAISGAIAQAVPAHLVVGGAGLVGAGLIAVALRGTRGAFPPNGPAPPGEQPILLHTE